MALEKAKQIVSANSVVVFSKTYCPFCVNVKKLLLDLGATYKAVELDTESDGTEIQGALAQWTKQRTAECVHWRKAHRRMRHYHGPAQGWEAGSSAD